MKFKLGTVVSLKSNGLLLAAEYQFLSLGGNENFTIPLMVVVEILYSTQVELDDETGKEKINIKGKDQYKCLYFSNRTMKIEENRFSENELQIYGKESAEVHANLQLNNVKWGDIVRFKTIDLEAGKKKSFNESSKSKGSKPILTFTSPALQVIGFASVENKEPLIDPYNGEKKREKTKKLVKCKFFNVESDKFSEQLIPIECLQKVDNSNINERLNAVASIIDKKQLCLLELEDKKYFGRPISAHVISGRYQLQFWNELLKKNETFWLDNVKSFEVVDINENGFYYPEIYEVNVKKVLIDPQNFISQNMDAGQIFKIVYRNLKEEILSRYISIINIEESFKEVLEGADGESVISESNTVYYLKSYCYYREAEREFRSDRILSLRTIGVGSLIDVLNETKIKLKPKVIEASLSVSDAIVQEVEGVIEE